MIVTVKLYLYLQEALGWKEITLDLPVGSTISALFRELRGTHRFPDRINVGKSVLVLFDGDKLQNLVVLVNGRHIKSLQGMATILENGAAVTLFPPSAGG